MARIAPSLTPNLAHLDHLSTNVVVDGRTTLATRIYADAPGYVPIGDPDEGIACVDDAARAAIVYLDEHERAARAGQPGDGGAHALAQARGALEFTLRMAEPDGRFTNFITDLQGTKNVSGPTSRADLGWWAFRGMWALAHGYRALQGSDPAFAARLLGAYERTEAALDTAIARSGHGAPGSATMRSRGRDVPSWLARFSPDAVSVAGIAMADMLEGSSGRSAAAVERTRRLLGTVAEGVAAVHVAPGADGTFAHAGHTPANPELWHAWGAHEGEVLARAGQLLGRRDLVDAARREVEGLAAWQLAAGRVHELTPLPLREGQQAYGVTMAVRGAMSLYRATGEERYAQMAGLHASWFAGNNMAREAMYDPATGRGYDGIDAPPRGVNRSSGAESTIEALMSLQAIAGTPEAERMARMVPVAASDGSWVAAPAAQFAATEGGAALVARPSSPAAGSPPITMVQVPPGARASAKVLVPAAGEYVVLAGRVRSEPGVRAADVDVLVDGVAAARVPARSAEDGPHVALDRTRGAPVRLTAGPHIVELRGIGTGEPGSAPALVAGLVLHPVTARTTLADGADRVELSWNIDAARLDIAALPAM